MGALPLALACGLAAAQPLSSRAVPLIPGQQGRHQLARGGGNVHELPLEAGRLVRLTVIQEGVDVTVALVAPDGARTEIDVAHGPHGREPASVLAGATGTYRIEVRASDDGATGQYTIDTGPAGSAGEEDRLRVRAERALAEGVALARGEFAESIIRTAVARLTSALDDWRSLGERGWEVETLLHRGAAHIAGYAVRDALADAAAALALALQLSDARGEARARNMIGSAYNALDEYDRALESCERALALARTLGERGLEIEILNTLGWVHSSRGEPRKHVELARRVLALRRDTGNRRDQAVALIGLGGAQANAGDLPEAARSFRDALTVFRALGDRDQEAVTLQMLGAQYANLGDYAGALDATEEALAIARSRGDRELEAVCHLSEGVIHSRLGEWRKALELYQKALPIYRELGIRRREALTLAMIGTALNRLHEYEAAARHLQEAMRISADLDERTTELTVLMSLGRTRMETGPAEAARADLHRAAELARSAGKGTYEADALSLLARIALEEGKPAEARQLAEDALGVLEGYRRRVTSPDLRATFASSVRDTYEAYIEALMGLHGQEPGKGFAERALEASEAARGRGLLDLLAEGGTRIREGVEPSLLQAERAVQERLSAALDLHLRLSQEGASQARVETAARDVQALAGEWQAARDRVRVTSPRFAELRDPTPATVSEIREQVLDPDTVLLEYALGEKRSFLWVVTREGLRTHELPARAVVEQAAHEAYRELATPRRTRSRRPDSLTRLGRMILAPLGDLTAKRLLVVPDGALHFVPLAALPHTDGSGEPLLAKHEVVSAPSASVIALLRRERKGRPGAPKAVAVFADPVFDKEDERLAAPRTASVGRPRVAMDEGMTTRVLRSAGVEGALQRLPFTRREAKAILSLVSPRERKEALDFDASRAAAADPALADYRIVHFATHGFLNTVRPELSGIVLSLVDREGRDVGGVLTAADIFNLRLNAEMVVLSGCRTALGRELRGEGLMGLSRAFMYAGAPRVVASLWKVDDTATAALMKRFYRRILAEGLLPSAALRAAQLDMARQPRFEDPSYWAAFQLHGDWR